MYAYMYSNGKTQVFVVSSVLHGESVSWIEDTDRLQILGVYVYIYLLLKRYVYYIHVLYLYKNTHMYMNVVLFRY